MNYTSNPDYPTQGGAGFLQHTYQPMNNQDGYFYYAGAGNNNPFQQSYNMDSRRNDNSYAYSGYPTNPGMKQPVPQQPAYQENGVMPFSSYPSATPSNMGLNSFAESRRYAQPQVQQTPQVEENPWANLNNPQFNAPVQYGTPLNTQPANPWVDQYTNPAYQSPEYSCSALYANGVNPFDKKAGAWENQYTMTRPIPMPDVSWNKYTSLNPNGQQQTTYQYATLSYPKMELTWMETMEKNFSNGSL